MRVDTEAFRTLIPACGFKIIRATQTGSDRESIPLLVPADVEGFEYKRCEVNRPYDHRYLYQGGKLRGREWATRHPVADVPTLHRQFARLETEEAILDFANRYGNLGGLVDSYQFPSEDHLGDMVSGESVHEWLRAAEELRGALRLFDWITNRKIDRLKIVIKREEDAIYYDSPYDGSFTMIASRANSPALWEALEESNSYIKPARIALCSQLNTQLQGMLSITFGLEPPDYRTLAHRSVPICLLGALWAQLANEFLGNIKTRYCRHCGKPLEAKRNTRQFCSDACRKAEKRAGTIDG